MNRFIMGLSLLVFLGIAAVMAISFLVNAVDVMFEASKVDPRAFVRWKNNPIRDLGYSGAAMIASIGVLLVCLKHVLRRFDNDDDGNGDPDKDETELEKWERTRRVKRAERPLAGDHDPC